MKPIHFSTSLGTAWLQPASGQPLNLLTSNIYLSSSRSLLGSLWLVPERTNTHYTYARPSTGQHMQTNKHQPASGQPLNLLTGNIYTRP